MAIANLIGIVAAVAIVCYIVGRYLSVARVKGAVGELHSLPSYHGMYAALWASSFALIALVIWLISQQFYITNVVEGYFPEGIDDTEASLRLSTVMTVAEGFRQLDERTQSNIVYGFSEVKIVLGDLGVPLPAEVPQYVLEAARDVVNQTETLLLWRSIVVIGLSVLGGVVGLMMIGRKLRARNLVERFIRVVLITGSGIAILTTFGIVMSMLTETIRFFQIVPPQDFFFGTTWKPGYEHGGEAGQADGDAFGLLPLLWGTAYISFIALLIAVPIGLFAAIYMSEFASKSVRSFGKPLLEILAGVPTIVYGFFALVTVGPFIRDTVNLIPGMNASASSVATAGIVMGMMIIPFVSSLSDDIINAVPQSLRDGSLGLGATKAETVRLVILPAALPGIVGAVLLAASRAIGETMIVVLAAGATGKISGNPFEPMTTVTVKIVSQLTGDVAFTSPQALVAFALGITLFTVTLVMNVYALRIVRKYREQYE